VKLSALEQIHRPDRRILPSDLVGQLCSERLAASAAQLLDRVDGKIESFRTRRKSLPSSNCQLHFNQGLLHVLADRLRVRMTASPSS